MWRVMEAGRYYERASKYDIESDEARYAKVATAKLRNLNAHKVSSSKQLFELANCDQYEGVKIGGRRCPPADENPYEKKRKAAKAAKKGKSKN